MALLLLKLTLILVTAITTTTAAAAAAKTFQTAIPAARVVVVAAAAVYCHDHRVPHAIIRSRAPRVVENPLMPSTPFGNDEAVRVAPSVDKDHKNVSATKNTML